MHGHPVGSERTREAEGEKDDSEIMEAKESRERISESASEAEELAGQCLDEATTLAEESAGSVADVPVAKNDTSSCELGIDVVCENAREAEERECRSEAALAQESSGAAESEGEVSVEEARADTQGVHKELDDSGKRTTQADADSSGEHGCRVCCSL